jgi:hypothetical protein
MGQSIGLSEGMRDQLGIIRNSAQSPLCRARHNRDFDLETVRNRLRAGVLVDDRAERLGGVVGVSVHKSGGVEVAKLAQA